MITYFLKTIICSAIFLFMYVLFLEKEKMHRFNRFYLLVTILISFIIPFIKIKGKAKIIANVEMSDLLAIDYTTIISQPATTQLNEHNFLPSILMMFYIAVTTFLLFRFVRNLISIHNKIKENKAITYLGATLVLADENIVPHSFLGYMFFNKKSFEKGNVEKEILQHELTHVRQKHSVDILLMELLLVFIWFNPVLYFYRKSIKLNHEFLADEAVINKYNEVATYQYLLVATASQPKSYLPTSQFNYLTTKKRLIMMTKQTTKRIAILKQIALFPLISGLVFSFSTKIIAQDSVKNLKPLLKERDTTIKPWVGVTIEGTKGGVAQDLLNEYENIVNKNKSADEKWFTHFSKDIDKIDRDRLETIFKQMSLEQQNKQTIVFMKPAGALPRVVPTETQFEAYKNLKIYGVWINGRKVKNDLLNQYNNTDFAQVFVSKLYGAAKSSVSYFYQVDLMTKDYY